jgi:squalene-hopene/tetraprenyl-beta-curcumene cyclase
MMNENDETIRTLTRRLLDSRTASGHWEGRLASSALSTATATVALALAQRASGRDHSGLVGSGLRWLIANQNTDGGWGDTVLDVSNLSTTVLCWAALSFEQTTDDARSSIDAAGRWLRSRAGDLAPERLKDAVIKRYGKDRTFSVPILTLLALTGKLGPEAKAWRMVPQLPFELAACPHRMFRWLRLPVVSYALPALVAIGQAQSAARRPPILASPANLEEGARHAARKRRFSRGHSAHVLRRDESHSLQGDRRSHRGEWNPVPQDLRSIGRKLAHRHKSRHVGDDVNR